MLKYAFHRVQITRHRVQGHNHQSPQLEPNYISSYAFSVQINWQGYKARDTWDHTELTHIPVSGSGFQIIIDLSDEEVSRQSG